MPHLGIPYSGQWIPHFHKGPGCQDCKPIKSNQTTTSTLMHFVSADLCESTVAFPSLFSSPFKQFAMLLQGAEAHTSLRRSSLECNKSRLHRKAVIVNLYAPGNDPANRQHKQSSQSHRTNCRPESHKSEKTIGVTFPDPKKHPLQFGHLAFCGKGSAALVFAAIGGLLCKPTLKEKK